LVFTSSFIVQQFEKIENITNIKLNYKFYKSTRGIRMYEIRIETQPHRLEETTKCVTNNKNKNEV